MLPVRTLHCVEQWHAIAQRSKRLGKGVDLIGNTVDKRTSCKVRFQAPSSPS